MSDEEQLLEVLRSTRPVFLDFDGPVCSMYPGDLNYRASALLRDLLTAADIELPPDIAMTRDPLTVLRYAAHIGDAALTSAADEALTALEIDAAATAPPTAGSDDLLRACRDVGRPVVIVSNNAAKAIATYLGHHRLRDLVEGIVGRPHARPDQMKPNPRILLDAIALVDEHPGRCVLIGDSATDIDACHAAGVLSIAYAKAPNRRAALEASSPDALASSMAAIAKSMRYSATL